MLCLVRVLRQEGLLQLLRILVMVADEGSQGFAIFNFLANRTGARVLFFRDPPHVMANSFTNSLRMARAAMASTVQVLWVHKFRRAP